MLNNLQKNCEEPPPYKTDMNDSSDKHLSRRETSQALRLSIFASCHGMVWVAVALGMPLTMFLEALGASGLVIGLAATVQQIAMGFQLPAGILANRMRRIKSVWFAFALPHRLIWFAVPVLPLLLANKPSTAALALVILLGISSIFANMASPAWFGWMSALIPKRESGRFWSIRQAFTMTAFLAATALTGWLLDIGGATDGPWRFRGFMIVFGIGAVFGITDVLIHMRVPPPEKMEPQEGRPMAALLNILRDRNFRMLTIAFGLWGLSCAIAGPFGSVYLKRTFSVTYSQLAAMTITFSIGSILASLFWGRIMDTIGARSFGSLMLLAVPLFALPWFFLSEKTYYLPWLGETTEAVVVFTITNFFSGAFFAGVALSQLNSITTLATDESRTIAMSLHFTIIGVIAAIGSTLGGRIMDLLTDAPIAINLPRGIAFSFFHVQTILQITFAVAAAWIFHKRSPAITDVPIRQLLGNPLRTLTIIQDLITVSTPRNEKARAKAIRRLSASGMENAGIMLEQALNDPSILVRREAIRALGKAATPQGILLLEKHVRESGDTELFPVLAVALGECGSETAVPVLIEMLNENTETRIEAIRALGKIGTHWVRHPLINLLQRSEDPNAIKVIGDALVKIASRQIDERNLTIKKTKQLARENSDFAVNELIKSLSDPSPDVQKATVAALGGIDSPAAIHALLHKLHSAGKDMKPEIARALVKSHNPDGLNALIENITEGDPENQIENVRSLGKTGDRRASGVLIEMVRRSDDASILSASSEALVHLREIAAFYDIIPRMKTTSNPLLKRTLAVAAGNLLGEGGSFYAFLMQEEHHPGSQTSRRISQLSRRIRRLCAKRYHEAEAPLTANLNAVESALEGARWPDAAARLFELAVGLATLTYGIEHSPEQKVMIEKLIWQDEHIGVCVWFLYMTTHEWNNPTFGVPTQLDVLLGLFALTEWNP